MDFRFLPSGLGSADLTASLRPMAHGQRAGLRVSGPKKRGLARSWAANEHGQAPAKILGRPHAGASAPSRPRPSPAPSNLAPAAASAERDGAGMAAADGDDSLYPIAVLIDELRNEDVQVRRPQGTQARRARGADGPRAEGSGFAGRGGRRAGGQSAAGSHLPAAPRSMRRRPRLAAARPGARACLVARGGPRPRELAGTAQEGLPRGRDWGSLSPFWVPAARPRAPQRRPPCTSHNPPSPPVLASPPPARGVLLNWE